MRKLSMLFGAIALTALVSCSSDEIVSHQSDPANLSKQSIGFAPLATKATRSTVYGPDAMFTNFRVIGMWQSNETNAWIEGKEYVTGTAGENQTAFTTDPAAGGLYQGFDNGAAGTKGLEIVNNGSGWDYKDQSKIQYWPYKALTSGTEITGYQAIALNFRGVAPANTALDLQGDLPGATPYKIESKTAVADMVDVCYAEATSDKSPVEMKFHHLFSQVVFKAKKAENYLVDIKEVSIGGVGVTLSEYPFAQIQKTAPICLSEVAGVTVGATKGEYPGFTSSSYITLPDQNADASPYQLTPAGQELILIPQLLNAWDKTSIKGETEANRSAHGCFVSITYRAKTKDAADWATGTGDGFKTIVLPIQAKWMSGHKYVYTFLVGGAVDPDDGGDDDDDDNDDNPDPDGPFDEEGHPEAPTVPITFTASVTEWTQSIIDVNI